MHFSGQIGILRPPPFFPLILVPTFALHLPTPQRHPRPRPDPCPHPHLAQVKVTLQSGGTKHKATLAMLRETGAAPSAPSREAGGQGQVRIATVLWVGESAGGRLLSTALSTGPVPKLRYLLRIVVVVLRPVLKRVIYTGPVLKRAPTHGGNGRCCRQGE